jgi:phosphoenolpyruvate-protein phosphotransferase (PTS system enzyme I)
MEEKMNLKGSVITKGIGIGKVFIYEPFQPTIIHDVEIQHSSLYLDQYEQALKTSHEELELLKTYMMKEDPHQAEIFSAHIEILHDIAMDEMIQQNLKEGIHPSKAVFDAYEMFVVMLSQVEDALIKERVADLKDVRLRVLRNLEQKHVMSLADLTEDIILVTHDLYPSDTASMNKQHVKGILTEVGSITSHTAIIARSYDIPAILGISNITKVLEASTDVILDTIHSTLITSPASSDYDHYHVIIQELEDEKMRLKTYLPLNAETQDGQLIEIHLNIESDLDDALDYEAYVDGVGLFRSEFLFMNNDHLPTLEEQQKAYQNVSKKMNGKPVTLRTLDIGGDKHLSYYPLPKEDNPFLGKRAIRLCFEDEAMFKTQIKAALMGSKEQSIELMFPMVGSIDEVIKLKALVDTCKKELTESNIDFYEVKFGVMIEIPSIALMADELVKHVDFASIGTNDLTQYVCAVDRMNQDISSYYQPYHPAVLRLIQMTSKAFMKAGKKLSICGELGGDPLAVRTLIGLGIRKLSMSKSQVAKVKEKVMTTSMAQCEILASKVTQCATQEEVLKLLN